MSAAVAFRGRTVFRVAAAIALAGGIGCAIGFVTAPRDALFGWLAAYGFGVSVALGALIFSMICHAMGACWPIVVRRLCEAVAATLPLYGLLFLPLALGLGHVFPWVHPAGDLSHESRELLAHKAPYLNVPGFLGRAAVYLVVWGVVATVLWQWSVDRDREGAPDRTAASGRLSAATLPAVALTMTFASFDWLMSLTPTWWSTMYGVYWFAGGFVAAIAAVTLLARLAERAGQLPEITSSHWYALGRLLFAFTVFWAYAAFFQFMLIWIANRPLEIVFYADRARGPFGAVSFLIAIARLVVPFAVLLPYAPKRSGPFLAAVSVWILAGHYLDVHWLVAPARGPHPFHWTDLASLACVGGATVAFAAWRLSGRPLAPRRDPRFALAARYESR